MYSILHIENFFFLSFVLINVSIKASPRPGFQSVAGAFNVKKIYICIYNLVFVVYSFLWNPLSSASTCMHIIPLHSLQPLIIQALPLTFHYLVGIFCLAKSGCIFNCSISKWQHPEYEFLITFSCLIEINLNP